MRFRKQTEIAHRYIITVILRGALAESQNPGAEVALAASVVGAGPWFRDGPLCLRSARSTEPTTDGFKRAGGAGCAGFWSANGR